MNKIVLAISLLALVEVTMAGVKPVSLEDACIAFLGTKLEPLEVPTEILKLIEDVQAEIVYKRGEGWVREIQDRDGPKLTYDHPKSTCRQFAKVVDEWSREAAEQFSVCAELMEGSASFYDRAHDHEKLGPILKAVEVCETFDPENMPHEADMSIGGPV